MLYVCRPSLLQKTHRFYCQLVAPLTVAMCVSDDTRLAPSSSPIFANSTFATASDEERRRPLDACTGVSAESPRALAPKFSAGWSRLSHALGASRAPSSTRTGGAAETPSSGAAAASSLPPSAGARQHPSTGGTVGLPRREPSKDAEPALLLLPDGSVQIVCSSQPSAAHSQTQTQTRAQTPRKNANGARVSSRAAASTDSYSTTSNSFEPIPRSDSRRATRVSDVLQDHPGCKVGSLTSSHGPFLRPQHVLKPGDVYFLQPPLALPAPHDHGTPVSGNGDADFDGSGSTALLIQDVDACNEDDLDNGRRCLEDVVASFSGSSGRSGHNGHFKRAGRTLAAPVSLFIPLPHPMCLLQRRSAVRLHFTLRSLPHPRTLPPTLCIFGHACSIPISTPPHGSNIPIR
ncbi:unnamed protein product [Closterium sp. NIES-65]|nr:unnamed protein product [Closterium sp. NIES-65]